ncbi:hypothetical protein AVEN_197705-1 [Araneus ventricosus]|uniref:Pre-C2HC domain-containing protein n=1 Tax=Araneus ventricosus TaxID=182803 RepID=A0A4Y2CL31_ARAVE|nr:hypothetical protein AVEN_197705-1 [Araneus ventricosus]
MTSTPYPYGATSNARYQRELIYELMLFQTTKFDSQDDLEAGIQKLRRKIGRWYNSNLHHIDKEMIKILSFYNRCLKERGYDSEFELNDEGVVYSDFSSAESTASELGGIKKINSRKDIAESTDNCKNNSMEIEDSVNSTEDNVNIATNGIGDAVNTVNQNDCNAIDLTRGEAPECKAEANIMNIDPADGHLISVANDDFQTQGRKRGRVHSNNSIPSKKLTRSNSLPLQNKYNALANLPDAGNSQDESELAKIQKIPPVTLRKPDDYRKLLKELNETEGIKCNAKDAGEFIKLFCESPKDVRNLVNYLDKNNKEYFVIPGKVVKPIKIVIKGLSVDMDPEDIKSELINLKFRVEKVNQLKRFKTREPLNIFQIHLFPSENIKEIYNLTSLSYYFITVKPYENRISHQCYNCQMWNHGSKGCKLAPICLEWEIKALEAMRSPTTPPTGLA